MGKLGHHTRTVAREPAQGPRQLGLIAEKKTTFKLPLDLYKKLKIQAVERGEDMSAIVTDALRRYLGEV